LTPATLFELGIVAAVAGFVDTLAGGGGLLTLPTLLLAQIPPLHALAINKVQSSFGSGTASISMMSHGLLDIREHWRPFLCALAGAVVGTILVAHINTRALDAIIPLVLVVICAYVIFAPNAGQIKRSARVSAPVFYGTVVPLIGVYDGCFGPGTGSFFALSAVGLRGMLLLAATAEAKFLNFATNIASATVFIAGGEVIWAPAAAMAVGQIAGATLGGRVLSKGHTHLIKPLIVAVSLGMIAKYAWQHFHG
jgi:uncharacterized membrane protein YfcA